METEKLQKALIAAKSGDWGQANEILGGFGIEHVFCAGRELKYINLGDSYDTTICQEIDTNIVYFGSWGTWYEETQQEYERENGVIRCSYCGEFTPMNKSEWSEVVCESCGHLVGG